jgi:multiple sugar transport system ATP-binding protein
MAGIVLDRVTKIYGTGQKAIDDVSLEIEDGEFMVLVGPSGCGKSTLLRMVAGLEDSSSGRIQIGDRDVTDLAPRDRDIAMVFQNYALYPHLTVRQNLGYALKIRHTPKDEIKSRVGEVARVLGLHELLERKPAQLSGGQRQRVAMGRAMVREPAAFLMDEPLSNLDAKLRVGMRAELSRLHIRLGVTTLYVTHDQIEAMTLGQRVAVMRDGVIQQLDSPQALYKSPTNLFVAAFIGSPAMNLVEANVSNGTVEFGGLQIPLDPARRPEATGKVIVGIRPEDFEDAVFADPGLPSFQVDIAVVEELGAETRVIFPVDADRVETEETKAVSDDEEAPLLADDTRSLFTARVDPRTDASPGSRLNLSLKPRQFHFFDPVTGNTLTGRSEPRWGVSTQNEAAKKEEGRTD